MPIRFSCACGRSIAVKDELSGKLIKCPACAKPVRVTADSGGAAAAGGGGGSNTRVKKRTPSVAKAVQPPEPSAAIPGSASGGTARRSKTSSRIGKRPAPLAEDLLPGGRVPPVTTRRQTEFQIKPLEDMTKKGQKKTFPCPGCKATLYEGDILCISCGMDLSTGQWVKPEVKEPAGYIPLILGLLLLLGLIGGIVWMVRNAKQASAPKPNETPGTVTPPPEAAPPAEDRTGTLAKILDSGSMFDFQKLATELAQLKEEGLPKLLAAYKAEKATPQHKKLALYGIALLTRVGIWNDDVVALYQTAVGDPDGDLKLVALQGLYMVATNRGEVPLDAEEFAKALPLFKGVKPVKQPVPAVRAAFATIAATAGDPLCPLAVKFATDCGDGTAVHVLIAGLASQDLKRGVQDQFRAMLRELTGDSYDTAEQWEQWWVAHQQQGPVEWLIGALGGANENLRASAARRLKRLTGADLPDWDPSAAAEAKAALAQKWKEWGEANKGKY